VPSDKIIAHGKQDWMSSKLFDIVKKHGKTANGRYLVNSEIRSTGLVSSARRCIAGKIPCYFPC
jgi:hypothetical protein